jgi:hypothetical protein
MKDLQAELLARKIKAHEVLPPKIFNLHQKSDKDNLLQLIKAGEVRAVYDQIDLALGELFDIKFPAKKDSKTVAEVKAFTDQHVGDSLDEYGVWVYYPWSQNLVHFPPVSDLRLLRTARNRNLILEEEQQKLYDATILVVGLSVGSSAVEMLLSEGIGGKIILVDMDIIEPTNLNRIKTTYQEVGTHKVDALAKRISEIDPFIEQVHFRDGLNADNLKNILAQYHPDIIIDEMDDLTMKLTLRSQAKESKIAVLMATDDGENAILDIERYDTNIDQQPFEGRIPEEIIQKVLAGQLTRPEIGMLIGKYFVGGEHIPLRMFESLIEVGKSIPSWPQLAGAATLSGVALAYAAKKIILKQPVHEGRHIFDMDHELDPEVESAEYKTKIANFQQRFFS